MRQTLVKARQLKSEWNEERRREIALEIDRMKEEEEDEEKKNLLMFLISYCLLTLGHGRSRMEKEIKEKRKEMLTGSQMT